MTYEIILALAAFAFVMSITPGPNNLMLMASGANYGWQRTLPHMLGVTMGFVVMTILAGIGLVQLFDAFPFSYTVLKTASILFLLYLAFKIATASPPPEDHTTKQGKPMTFMQAALFQWVNPKAMTMSLTAISAFTPEGSGIAGVALVAVIFGAINLPSINFWVLLGTQLRRILNVPWKLRAFNITAALLLVTSLYPILYPAGF
ncbi:MAG: LysE family translocator [Paracoccaceae bacterium]